MRTDYLSHPPIKCVVWDLDNTLWRGVAVEEEAGTAPEPDPRILDIIAELEKRGIVSSVASRNDPALGKSLLSISTLAGKFVAPQVSWEPKSQAVRRVAEQLNIGIDSLAFVDDSAFERAEVAYMLPAVLVLSPEELPAALDSVAFKPALVTDEASRRADMYRAEEERRAAEESFAGSRTDFLRSCRMRLTIVAAGEDDLDRITELAERTHQLNSTGRSYTRKELRSRIADKQRRLVLVARLTDRFGDYGTIGAALVDKEPPGPADIWLAELVMLSCRVEGRGIPAALLRAVMLEAQAAACRALRAHYRVNERNLPIRLLFRQMGFEVIGKDTEGTILAARDLLSAPLPPYPEWLEVVRPREACE